MEESENETLTKRERKKLNREEKKSSEEESNKNEMFKKLGIVALVVVGTFFAWKLITTPTNPQNGDVTSNTDSSATAIKLLREDDYVFGNATASAQLIEYGDFQCPACGTYYQLLKEIKAEFGDTVAFTHRNFPLRSIHRHAQIAAQAAEAAGLQGMFWEMHDKLYENQDTWSNVRDPRSDFEGYASEIGLDVEKFTSDMNSDEVKGLVDRDYTEATLIGLNSTPSFILNGEVIQNPQGLGPFRELLNSATESAEVAE